MGELQKRLCWMSSSSSWNSGRDALFMDVANTMQEGEHVSVRAGRLMDDAVGE